MKKLSLFLGVTLSMCSQLANAQDIFKQHGFDKEPLTLSNGRYNEFFNNDEVVQIGTVLLNTKTNKVVAFVEEDTAKTKYLSELSTRWLSIDPLARKYPQVSPYVYCMNNPILFIDPDGKEIWIAIQNNKGEYTEKVKYSNGKLYNENGSKYTGNNSYITKVQGQLTEIKGMNGDVNKVVSGLESSDRKHIITFNQEQFRENGATNEPTHKDIGSKINEKGELKITSGSITNFDPNATTNVNGEKDDARSQLAHELSHASDKDNATTKEGFTSTGVELNEVDAINVENKIRTNPAVGLDKRTGYYKPNDIPKELLK